MGAAVSLAKIGVTMRAVPSLPPGGPDRLPENLWARVAAELATYPVGAWVAVGGVQVAAQGPYGASPLVVACRRRGFRVAVRQRPDGLYVLRGRPLATATTEAGPDAPRQPEVLTLATGTSGAA